MKKQFPTFIALVALIFGILANSSTKAQLSTWSLPPFMVNFNPDGTTSYKPFPQPGIGEFGYQGEQPNGSHNMIHDVNGELLFFIIDGKIYDKDGYLLVGYNSSTGCSPCLPMGISETVIIPVPGQCKRFYIVSAIPSTNFLNPPLKYSILDLDLPNEITSDLNGNHWGAIDPAFENIDISIPSQKCTKINISATRRMDDRAFLLVSSCENGKIFEITDNGLVPTTSTFFKLPGGGGFNRLRTETEVIVKDDKFLWAWSVYDQSGGSAPFITIAELNFDGTIGNHKIISTHAPLTTSDGDYEFKGMEFSQNGEYLYFTAVIDGIDGNPDQFFTQYIDLTANTVHDVPNVPTWKIQQIPLSHIELGINNKLYYSTSSGLIALSNSNNPNSTWQYFGLPGGQTINLTSLISNLDNNLRLLPDQIDGNDYSNLTGLSSTCCNFMYTGSRPYFTATTSATWTAQNNPIDLGENVIYIGNELRIPAGKHIIIKNMIFKFGQNAKVVVEKGARLELRNSTFTAVDCSRIMWKGVEVLGSGAGESQSKATKHGKFQVLNSLIEHAYIGAYTLKGQGGIIQVEGSTFQNNQIGISINTFHNVTLYGNKPYHNLSYITNSKFRTTYLLNIPSKMPAEFIELIENEGINISGCEFSNLVPDLFTQTQRGNGIISKDASYRVISYCPVGQPGDKCNPIFSSFSNLDYGIHASNLISTLPITVNQVKFEENYQGILLDGANFSAITNNTFKIKNNGWGATVDPTYGLYMYGCTKYIVENNLFNTDQIAGRTVGIFVSQSGEDYNRIYDNEFLNLFTGTMALGVNGTYQSKDKGLRINCNVYTNAIYDIGLREGDISPVQGEYVTEDLSLLAGNRFYQTYCNQNNDNQFVVVNRTQQLGSGTGGIKKITYQHAYDTDHNLFCFTEEEINNAPIPTVFYNENQCANSIYAKSRPKIKEKIKEIDGIIKEKEKPLLEGNSPEIIAALKNQNGVYTQKLHTDLNEKSPYLSEEVIRLVAIKTNIANLKRMQVLEKNLPLPRIVRELIAEPTYTHLSEAQKQTLLAAEGISEREHLENVIALYKSEREISINEIIRQHLNDSIVEFDSIRHILQVYHPDYEKHLEMDIEITEGKFAKAKAIMNTIYLEDQNLNRKEVNEKTIRLKENSITNQSAPLTTEDNAALETIAEDMADPSFFKARNLLYHSTNIHRPEERKLPELMIDPGMMFLDEEKTEEPENDIKQSGKLTSYDKENKSMIRIYPNPSDGKVFIQVSNTQGQALSIKVKDLLGREVFSSKATEEQSTIENLVPGVYLVSIYRDAQLVNVSKLVVN